MLKYIEVDGVVFVWQRGKAIIVYCIKPVTL